MRGWRDGVGVLSGLAFLAAQARAGNGSTAGTLRTDLTTCHGASFLWEIGGDDDADARVQVQYRVKGTGAWREALDFHRCETAALDDPPPAGSTLFAGSVLNLSPGTIYEVRLALVDPDGGGETRIVEVTTWKEPEPPSPARAVHVAPGSGGGSGVEADPYRGLQEADLHAQPGDHMLLHAGTYSGGVTLGASGAEAAPVVWKPAGDGEVRVASGSVGLYLEASNVFLEDVTFETQSWRGVQSSGESNVTLRGLKITMSGGYGIGVADGVRFFVADCEIAGPYSWDPGGAANEDRGINISGEGCEVSYNTVHHFKDGIDTSSRTDGGVTQAIDIHHNDVWTLRDDGIELDHSAHNVRCFSNRVTNAYMGISFQPIRGGPVYVYRNSLYNIDHEIFKLHNYPSGMYFFHNTCVGDDAAMIVSATNDIKYAILRNNLFIGNAYTYVLYLGEVTMLYCDFDYDAYVGVFSSYFVKWNSAQYATLADFTAGTGQEANGLYRSSFAGLLSNASIPVTDASSREYSPAENDLRLAPGAFVIDAGVHVPTVNDGYSGSAPDIGCFESGEALPYYGARPEGGLPDPDDPDGPGPRGCGAGACIWAALPLLFRRRRSSSG